MSHCGEIAITGRKPVMRKERTVGRRALLARLSGAAVPFRRLPAYDHGVPCFHRWPHGLAAVSSV